MISYRGVIQSLINLGHTFRRRELIIDVIAIPYTLSFLFALSSFQIVRREPNLDLDLELAQPNKVLTTLIAPPIKMPAI